MIKKLTLCVYSPLGYVLPERRSAYEEKYDVKVGAHNSIFRQLDREKSLVGLMRIGILKRMESSIHSFALTVDKILGKINAALDLIERKQWDYDVETNIEDIDLDDPDLDNLLFGNNIKVLLQDMDLIKWKQDLLADRDKLETIYLEAVEVTPDRDAKLAQLKDLIQHKVNHPINPENQKVIVFTAFSDTAEYLYANLGQFFADKGLYAALVTGSGTNQSTLPLTREQKKTIRITDLNTVLTLFSPRSKECHKIYPEMDKEIDVIIATDCISEGQNLQDCDYLVNYDIHWNPVRIIQRFGRIDRIGSINDVIQLVNFWATRDLDEYINLQQRVQGRMVLMDVSATGEENLIETDANKEMKDLEYRRNQLKRLQSEVVDLEDISGAISITDLTFNDFKIDLMEYMKENRKVLEQAPNGMYAVAEIPESLREELKPGVIFTLRQVKAEQQLKEQNPLYPYYMAYVSEEGVHITYTHAKKILDYYKKLCSGKKEVFRELVDAFNQETDDGLNMKAYSDQLEAAIENLTGKKEEFGAVSLFSKGGTTLTRHRAEGLDDFELITFLVLR